MFKYNLSSIGASATVKLLEHKVTGNFILLNLINDTKLIYLFIKEF
jgi:hypothetical protein